MKSYVDSFKRLYRSKRINKTFLDTKLSEGKITQEEYDYIVII